MTTRKRLKASFPPRTTSDMLGNLPDALISSIFEFIRNGTEHEGTILPFNTRLDEAAGVEDGLTEDEFFFLLDFYECNGDQLIADNLIVEVAPETKTAAADAPTGAPIGAHSVGAPSKENLTKQDLERIITTLRATTPKKMKGEAPTEQAVLTDIMKVPHKWEKFGFAKEQIPPGIMDFILSAAKRGPAAHLPDIKKDIQRVVNMGTVYAARSAETEKRYHNRVEKLARKLWFAEKKQDIKDAAKDLTLLKKKRALTRRMEMQKFMAARRKILEDLRKNSPLAYREFMDKADKKFQAGLRGMWNLVVGYEKATDDAIILAMTKKVDPVLIKKYGIVQAEREAHAGVRRVPGIVQALFGMRVLTKMPGPPDSERRIAQESPHLKKGLVREKIVPATRKGTKFFLFGREAFSGKDADGAVTSGEQDMKNLLHRIPWPERGVLGPESRRAMKNIANDMRAMDTQIWRMKRQMAKIDRKSRVYKELAKQSRTLWIKRQRMASVQKRYAKQMESGKKLTMKYRKGKLSKQEVSKSMGPLVGLAGAAIVAAGIVWFKARHTREMLTIATNNILREANRRGMYFTTAEVRQTVKQILRSPTKVRQVANAIEMAKKGIAVQRAGNILADIAIADLGIAGMPIGQPHPPGQEPTATGEHRGYMSGAPGRTMSVPSTLEPFSF